MRKFRRKQRRTRNAIIISIFLFIFFTISGYALLSERLNIGGTAKNSDYWTNNKLQVSLNQTNSRYTAGTWNGISWSSENYDGVNNLSTYFTKTTNTNTTVTSTFIITIRNPYSVNMTTGTATRTVVSGSFTSTSIARSTATIAPNGTGTVTLTLGYRTRNVGTGQVRGTISYVVNGVTKYFYFTVYIS